MEMADFAEMNSGTVDQLLLQRLRSDALQIRRCAFMLLARWAVERGGDVVQIKAFLVASMYTGMTARMVQLIEQSAGEALPCFVGAM